MRAFILAGGFATRLWPLTEHRAKPLLPLAGKPILSHIVEAIPTEIPIVVSTNAAFEDSFRAWAKTQARKNIAIRIEHTRSDNEKLGALGAVRQWVEEEKIEEDILLLTGDNYFGFKLNTFIDQYDSSHALLAAYDIGSLDKAKSFGTVLVEGTTVTGFEEKPQHPKSTLVSTGCSVLPKATLPILTAYAKEHPDNVGGIFEELLRREQTVRCFTFREPWFDIGSFEAYLEATKQLVGGECVVIGKDSTVKDSTLKNTVIFERCVIEDCMLEHCVIDDDCVLKGIDLSGQMLRKGTKLIA